MEFKVLIFIVLVLCSAAPMSSVPVDKYTRSKVGSAIPQLHSLWKRFIDSSSSFGEFNHNGFGKIRTKRSSEEEQCEKLELCRLHAHSSTSFLAAFQLYFVNKENARLWDRRAHSAADCERRFSCDR